MDTFEIALNYADSAHGGDRRKKSQQCHLAALYICVRLKILRAQKRESHMSDSGLASVCNSHERVPWAKSKALLGSLTGLQRSRVSELINPEPDRPLAPHWRASWLFQHDLQPLRFSSEVWKQLVGSSRDWWTVWTPRRGRSCSSWMSCRAGGDGLNVLVFLMFRYVGSGDASCKCRFAEWGAAVWEMQRDYMLLDQNRDAQKFDVHFVGIYHDDEAATMQKTQEVMNGRLLTQWWDSTSDAGPRARPAQKFEEAPPAMEILTIAGAEVKRLVRCSGSMI